MLSENVGRIEGEKRRNVKLCSLGGEASANSEWLLWEGPMTNE